MATNLGDFLICSVLTACGLPTGLYWWLSSIPLNVAGVLEGIPLTKEGVKPRGKRSHTLRVREKYMYSFAKRKPWGGWVLPTLGVKASLPASLPLKGSGAGRRAQRRCSRS